MDDGDVGPSRGAAGHRERDQPTPKSLAALASSWRLLAIDRKNVLRVTRVRSACWRWGRGWVPSRRRVGGGGTRGATPCGRLLRGAPTDRTRESWATKRAGA